MFALQHDLTTTHAAPALAGSDEPARHAPSRRHGTVVSTAEVAECNCPDICQRDHEHD